MNQDGPAGTGDYETTSYFGENDVCSSPTGFEARFCCPKLKDSDEDGNKYIMDGTCDDPDYDWTIWLNADSPVGTDGDWETIGKMPRRNICENPTGIRARTNGVGET